jgi:hypothetical protein
MNWGKMKNAYKIFVIKLQRKDTLENPSHRKEENFQVDQL